MLFEAEYTFPTPKDEDYGDIPGHSLAVKFIIFILFDAKFMYLPIFLFFQNKANNASNIKQG